MHEREIEAAVRHHALEFRTAFEMVVPKHPLLPHFPRGWCTAASMFLGEYLRGKGLGNFYTRSGLRQFGEFSKTHAWLEQDGLVVDITGDQFLDVDEAVICSWDSEWHREWSPLGGNCLASLAYYDRDDYQELVRDIYERLNSVLEGPRWPPGRQGIEPGHGAYRNWITSSLACAAYVRMSRW